jgi:hypothetical protein
MLVARIPSVPARGQGCKVARLFTLAASVSDEVGRIDMNYFLTRAGRTSIACLDRPTAGDAAFLRLGWCNEVLLLFYRKQTARGHLLRGKTHKQRNPWVGRAFLVTPRRALARDYK